MAEVNLLVIRKTQELLGKHVKKPALSEKLLKKPPFRFMHDVVNVIIRDTGYLEGVYSERELQFENVKDKEAKIEFLQKLIDAVKSTSADKIKVKPTKVVAGLEPERTNELLQAIGKAVDAHKGNNINHNVDTKHNSAATKPVVDAKANARKTLLNSTDSKSSNPSKLGNKPAAKKSSLSGATSSSSTASLHKTKGAKPVKSETGKEKVPNDNAVPIKAVLKEDETTLRRSGTEIIVREGELKKEATDDLVLEKDSLVDRVESQIDAEANNNNKTVESISQESGKPKDDASSETNDSNLTQVLSQLSNTIEPQEIPSDVQLQAASGNSDLIDVIDQEAEIRRRERSGRKHRERRKSSGHTTAIDESAIQTSVDMPTVEEIAPLKSSKSRKPSRTSDVKSAEEVADRRPKAQVSIEEIVVPMIRPRTSLRPPSVRPASARPGAPRRRDKNVEIFLQPSDDAVQMAGINVKVDKFPEVDLDDDGDNLIVIEDPMIGIDASTIKSELVGNDLEVAKNYELGSDQHGHLVQQILQTQKDLTKPDNDANDDIEKDFTTNRERQSSAKQMDMLRDSIQTLTRSINPLGKLMDFLQEDIDSMQMELAAWRRTYLTTKADLKRESSLNETAVQPLKQQLAQIEMTIREHIDLTNASRLNILQNEEKIFKLLSEL